LKFVRISPADSAISRAKIIAINGTDTAQSTSRIFWFQFQEALSMRKLALQMLAGSALALFLPLAAFAQTSGIAGDVKDTSGAVLPGVTVEVSSPALIERTRTATTDGAGRFSITNLRTGTYSVTFTLPGFNTVKRDGIELPKDLRQASAVRSPLKGEAWCGVPPSKAALLAKNEINGRIKLH